MSKRALVANNDLALSRVLEACLKTMGWTVDCATDAQAAVEMFSRQNHDVLLCDVHLGGWHGIETAQKLQAMSPSLQVVMVSGWRDHLEHARAQGFENCLPLPFEPAHLKSFVGQSPTVSA